ncbi:MAG: C40 family peptidase [Quadrisphaera sp.]
MVGVALGLQPAAGGVDTAAASPRTPSQSEVDAARAAAGDKAGQVAAVQAELAAAQAALDTAQVQAAVAAEAYDAAATELATRTTAAQSAAVAALDAQQRAEQARAAVGRLAAGTYRSGGGLDRVSAFMSADGPQDLLDRAALLDVVSQSTDRAYEQLRAAESVAGLLQQQSAEALAQQQQAAAAAQSARDAASSAADAATAMVATTQQRSAELVAQLAQLQGISTALAAQRQAGLAAQAAAAADAAARADRARRQASAASSGSGSGGTGSGSGGSTSSGSTSSSGSGGSRGSSSGGAASVPSGSSSASSSQAAAALAWARTQIGDPYEWGATGPDSWDCSGLTSVAYRSAGASLPRTSSQQYRAVKKISYDDMRPGDLIFYGTDPDDPSTVYHVAIYAGGGEMVEAPRTGLDVRETSVRYANSMTWAGRV